MRITRNSIATRARPPVKKEYIATDRTQAAADSAVSKSESGTIEVDVVQEFRPIQWNSLPL